MIIHLSLIRHRITAVIYAVHRVAFPFQVGNRSTMNLHGAVDRVHKTDQPTELGQLVQWATLTFGGVTSLTAVRNPSKISFTGREGECRQCLMRVTDCMHAVSRCLMQRLDPPC